MTPEQIAEIKRLAAHGYRLALAEALDPQTVLALITCAEKERETAIEEAAAVAEEACVNFEKRSGKLGVQLCTRDATKEEIAAKIRALKLKPTAGG